MTDAFPFRRSYRQRVLSVAPDARIAYWPMGEPSGAVAFDTGVRFNGAYTAVALGQPGIGDGGACPSFDGAASFANIYSAGLSAVFGSAEGSALLWMKVSGVGVWTDGTTRRMLCLQVDGNNRVRFDRVTTNNRIDLAYSAGAVTKTVSITGLSTTDWLCLALTWSKSADQMKAYMNGVQQGATQTGLGVWAGVLASTATVLGAANTTPANVWSGTLAHAALWARALSDAEVAELVRVN